MDFPNGWTISVKWGACTYSDNYSADFRRSNVSAYEWKSRTAEVAAWRTEAPVEEAWYDGNPNGVRGRQTVDQVMAYMRTISDLENVPQPVVYTTSERK